MCTLITICSLIICTSSSAQPIAKGDPAIGSHLFFVALDRKCPKPDSARAAALEKFKSHFLASVRPIAQSYGADGAKMLQSLEELEQNGPSENDIAKLDSIFQEASAKELTEFCDEAPKHIEERIALENMMKQAMQRALSRQSK